MEEININETKLQVKEYNGQRVVTFADIDRVHERASETAKYRFRDNKKYFIEGIDYFEINRNDVGANFTTTYGFSNKAPKGMLLTESGYLMVVKSFTDDIAWSVQRQLVNSYFKFKEVVESLQQTNNGLILDEHNFNEAIDTITTCAAIFQNMIDYSTINYKQQQELLQIARNRVNFLLDGAHSKEYKEHSRVYFKNLWLNFAINFQCSTYKDLNPLYMDTAKEFLNNWIYN